ncbi:MAG: outer membrane lipoprotein-sorting protein [Prosthecobacter sp.]|uniref:outer membrane lipoprotein-sorting protein n=1 Tax=Prosthecobacter sp. TaxID=1965333 RepID=UPI0025E7F8FF|nr:outer membrane lipoprotein-sorting protein [Prosthecobacter sp.]MCF7785427.1 outer membrane lipoprotein-sorting protein [Prosthecobacter sp.]
MKQIILATLLLTPCLHAAAAQPKTAEEILHLVRQSYASQNQTLQGELRDDSTGRTEPLELTMGNQVMNFQFTNPPPEAIRLDFNSSPAKLYQVSNGKTKQVPSSQLGSQVRGMDLNYEDLSLGFLYWPKPQLMGESRVSGQKCWIVRVMNPGKTGPYYAVDIYVHQASGGAAKMAAYDRSSKIIKRYEVTKIQKVNGTDALKELRFETLDPASGKVQGRTYMKMNKPAKP